MNEKEAPKYATKEIEERELQERREKINLAVESLARSQEGALDPQAELYFPELLEQVGFGYGRYHKWDVPEHTRQSLLIYRSFDFIPDLIRKFLQEKIDGVSRDKLLELAICFHDAGKKKIYEKTKSMHGHGEFTADNQLDAIVERFKLTPVQRQYLYDLIYYHISSLEQDQSLQKLLDEKGVFVEAILLKLADLMGTQGQMSQADKIEKRLAFTKGKLKEISDRLDTQHKS